MDPAWKLGVDLLSSEEAGEFCAKLGISTKSQSPLTLLNAIVQGVNAMPFHNLQLLATEPAKRKPPTGEEAKIAMLKGEGGLCFVKQAFAGHLLEALGYKVDVLAARVTHPGNHVIILVHDVVERGDCFLVKSGVDIHPLQWFPLLMELSSIISGSPSWNFATSKQKANP